MEILHRISLIEIFTVDLIIFLLAIAGFINLIKNTITAAKSPNRKQRNKYHTQDNPYHGDTGYHSSSNYDSSSCDAGSSDCGGGD